MGLDVFARAGVRATLGNVCLSAAGLAMNTTSQANMTTANAVTYTIDGVFKSKAAISTLAFSSGHTALASNQSCIFAVVLDAAGNPSTIQGGIFKTALQNGVTVYVDKDWGQNVTQSQSDPYPPNAAVFDKNIEFAPVIPADRAVIGLVKVDTGASATFTPGVTLLNATGITATFYDVMHMPAATNL